MEQIRNIPIGVVVDGIKLFEQSDEFKLNPVYNLLKKDPENFYLVANIENERILRIDVAGFTGKYFPNNYSDTNYLPKHICKLIIDSYYTCYNGNYALYKKQHIFENLCISEKLSDKKLNDLFDLSFSKLELIGDHFRSYTIKKANNTILYLCKYEFSGTYIEAYNNDIYTLPYGQNVKCLFLGHSIDQNEDFCDTLNTLYPKLQILYLEGYPDRVDFSSIPLKVLIMNCDENYVNKVIIANPHMDIIISDFTLRHSSGKYNITQQLLDSWNYKKIQYELLKLIG